MSTTGSQSAAVNASKPRVTGLKSMTGYAQARAVENDWNLRITIRSVNHRFLDLHLRLPEGFEPVEPRIRKILRERVRRGHLDVNLHYELAGPAAVGVNEEVAAAYLTAINALRKQFSIQTEPDLAALFRLPGVIGAATGSLDKGIERIETVVVGMLNEALDRLDRMRAEEGVHLVQRHECAARDDHCADRERGNAGGTRTARVCATTRSAAERIAGRRRRWTRRGWRRKWRSPRNAAMCRRNWRGWAVTCNNSRSLIATGSDAGKKLDFLLQEMQRESNTLLSKTPGNEADGLEITRLGLEIKSEIEKLREQVQNIE